MWSTFQLIDVKLQTDSEGIFHNSYILLLDHVLFDWMVFHLVSANYRKDFLDGIR